MVQSHDQTVSNNIIETSSLYYFILYYISMKVSERDLKKKSKIFTTLSNQIYV